MSILFLPSKTTRHSFLSVPSFPSIPTSNDAEWLDTINKKSLRLNTVQNQYKTGSNSSNNNNNNNNNNNKTVVIIIINSKGVPKMIDWIELTT